MGQFCSQPEEEPVKKKNATPMGGLTRNEDPVEVDPVKVDPVKAPAEQETPKPDPTPAPIVPEW